MRKTIMLAASLALWAGPALASHLDPQTFARFPADPPVTTASVTAPAGATHSAFPMYTPIPAGPVHRTVATAPAAKSPFSMYTPMPAARAEAAATTPPHG